MKQFHSNAWQETSSTLLLLQGDYINFSHTFIDCHSHVTNYTTCTYTHTQNIGNNNNTIKATHNE